MYMYVQCMICICVCYVGISHENKVHEITNRWILRSCPSGWPADCAQFQAASCPDADPWEE